jgi:antitoxin VapB
MRKAKVFKNGRSQAIRLPKEFRVEGNEVFLKRTAAGILITVADPWDAFLEGVHALSDDFMAGGRKQPVVERRSWGE